MNITEFENVEISLKEYERKLKEDGLFIEQNSSISHDLSYQILGMISHRSDLFLFERPVPYSQKAEVWLLKVEYCSQETVSKMIGYAVSSFPKQPLDEWIIDYPQQTILNTIHLILTHEVNEMLNELRRDDPKAESNEGEEEMQTNTLGFVDSSNLENIAKQAQEVSKLTDSEIRANMTESPEPSREIQPIKKDTQKTEEKKEIKVELNKAEGNQFDREEGTGKEEPDQNKAQNEEDEKDKQTDDQDVSLL